MSQDTCPSSLSSATPVFSELELACPDCVVVAVRWLSPTFAGAVNNLIVGLHKWFRAERRLRAGERQRPEPVREHGAALRRASLDSIRGA